MIPIRDASRSKTTPHITRILIVANVLAFIPMLLYIFFSSDPTVNMFANWVYNNFTMVPAEILRGENLHTLFTSLFLHADIFHIGGNMLYLYIFGDNIEDTFGHLRFLLFYFVCGLVADFAHILSIASSAGLLIPTLGASGAISGVMGAYILLYPRARIETLVLTIVITVVSIPAVFFLGFWFILQLLYTWLDMGGNVAYWAHIGGFVAGMILGLIAKRRRKPKPEIPYYREISI
ncbi:MAG TPA: rhomboid family intramembrane serine protease [Candidatus Bathyarchaeota archaeon]|nr:rhomboid family intramembrane serine protease [Candidatus Bathyarchaeota archaeon]